jgi:hypothetical protein
LSKIWYKEKIEPEVRDLVRDLRNQGVNTTCSCGHNMYIEFNSDDPSEDFSNIRQVLIDRNIKNWKIEIEDVCISDQIYYGRGIIYLNAKKIEIKDVCEGRI